jgi:hypothetical protein
VPHKTKIAVTKARSPIVTSVFCAILLAYLDSASAT